MRKFWGALTLILAALWITLFVLWLYMPPSQLATVIRLLTFLALGLPLGAAIEEWRRKPARPVIRAAVEGMPTDDGLFEVHCLLCDVHDTVPGDDGSFAAWSAHHECAR